MVAFEGAVAGLAITAEAESAEAELEMEAAAAGLAIERSERDLFEQRVCGP